MTMYQECHRHYGYLTRETAMARKLLERHGKPTPQTVKELRGETDMPMRECADMLRCLWRDMELERLQAENAKLRDENSRLQKYASKAWLAFPYCDGCPYADCGCDTETVPMHEGCKAFEELRELGIEVDDGTE